MVRRDAREGRRSTGGRLSSLDDNTREWMDGIDSLQSSAVLYSNTYDLVCKTKIINTVFRIKTNATCARALLCISCDAFVSQLGPLSHI